MKEILPPPPPPTECTPEVFEKCENNSLCQFCSGCSLYKNSREIKAQKDYNRQENKKNRKNETFKLKYEKGGMALEKKVAKQWNDSAAKKKKPPAKPRFSFMDEIEEEDEKTVEQILPKMPSKLKKASSTSSISDRTYGKSSSNEAQRQINSGALWFSKGDVTLDHALMEVKERGTKNARGEKTISIPKLWLEKQEDEATQEGKLFWYLPFAYKNDDRIYLVKPYEHEIQMVQDLRLLEEENIKLRKQLELKGGDLS